jgi:hypothetical protein
MEERQARWHLIAGEWRRRCSALEVVVAWRGITSGSQGGERRHGAPPVQALVGKNEKGGDGVRATRRCVGGSSPKEKKGKRGVRYGDEGENREPASVPGKEGRTVQGSEASVAPCCGHASTTHVGPATDGFRRTHRDSDPASVERSPSTGATSHRCSNYSRPLVAIFSLSFFPFFFFPFESNLHQPFI